MKSRRANRRDLFRFPASDGRTISVTLTIVCLKLEEILGPSKLPKPPKPVKVKAEPKPPRSVSRIPEIERNIALGVELLALREAIPSNSRFGRELRSRFEVGHIHTSRVMRVARLYSMGPEIYRAVSWRTLIELASPKMWEAVRLVFEQKVLSGEEIPAFGVFSSRSLISWINRSCSVICWLSGRFMKPRRPCCPPISSARCAGAEMGSPAS
jgi:hypothetical protein